MLKIGAIASTGVSTCGLTGLNAFIVSEGTVGVRGAVGTNDGACTLGGAGIPGVGFSGCLLITFGGILIPRSISFGLCGCRYILKPSVLFIPSSPE